MDTALMVTDDGRRPYAAAANVIGVIERIRRINLPEAIDTEFLNVARVPEAARGRVLDALRFLRLIYPGGEPTEALQAIASATDEEYRELLAARIREAYAADLTRVDPAQDTQATVESQFRRYQPRSQTMRMVMLFLGLCRAAGMPVLDAPRQRAMRQAPAATSRQPRPTAVPSRSSGRSQAPSPDQNPLGQVVSISLDDLALIEDETTYKDVWEALGKVNRAVARARQGKASAQQETPEEDSGH
jgi:hypothetical protein